MKINLTSDFDEVFYLMQISDKVVCVDDKPGWGTLDGDYVHPNGFVEKGKIYCISDIFITTMSRYRGDMVGEKKLMVRIVGVPVIYKSTGEVFGFRADRFRRLEDIKQEKKAKESIQIPVSKNLTKNVDYNNNVV